MLYCVQRHFYISHPCSNKNSVIFGLMTCFKVVRFFMTVLPTIRFLIASTPFTNFFMLSNVLSIFLFIISRHSRIASNSKYRIYVRYMNVYSFCIFFHGFLDCRNINSNLFNQIISNISLKAFVEFFSVKIYKFPEICVLRANRIFSTRASALIWKMNKISNVRDHLTLNEMCTENTMKYAKRIMKIRKAINLKFNYL